MSIDDYLYSDTCYTAEEEDAARAEADNAEIDALLQKAAMDVIDLDNLEIVSAPVFNAKEAMARLKADLRLLRDAERPIQYREVTA